MYIQSNRFVEDERKAEYGRRRKGMDFVSAVNRQVGLHIVIKGF